MQISTSTVRKTFIALRKTSSDVLGLTHSWKRPSGNLWSGENSFLRTSIYRSYRLVCHRDVWGL